jgi:phage shock protein C
MNDRLYRSRSDRMLAGVAGGLSEHFDLDPSIVRVGWALLALLTGGVFLVIYIVMAIVVPEDPLDDHAWTASYRASTGTGGASGFASTQSSPGHGGMGGTTAASDPTAAPPPGPGAAPGDPAAAAGAAGGAAWGPGSAGWSPQGERAARRAEREARRAARRADRSGYAGAAIAGIVLILIGSYFLVRTIAPGLHLERFWPALLVAIGAVLIVASVRRVPPKA